MKLARLLPYAVLVGVSMTLSACGAFRSALVPDEPGLYANTGGGELQRLDGPADWERETWAERSDLSRDVHLVVAHPSLAEGTDALPERIRLRKVGWLRSEIGPNGVIAPVDGAKWVAPPIEGFTVPLDYAEVDGRADVIEARPRSGALEPGLYALELRTGAIQANGRLGVEWTGLDQTQYASAHCIDRYAESAPAFRHCSEQAYAEPLDGLQVHLVEPERRSGDGGEFLVVRGLVVNNSGTPRQVPTLRAVLHGEDGRRLHAWPFAVPDQELAPGQSVSFQTGSDKMVAETHSVRVEFMPQAVVRK